MSLFARHFAEMISSLRDEPDDWEIDGYTAENQKRQMRIWHENRYYAVSLKVGSAQYGGSSFRGTFFGWLTPWRRAMCRAVDECGEAQRLASMRRANLRVVQ